MDELDRRKTMTFGQAEGVVPIPAQLSFRQVSQQLRALLWAVFDLDMKEHVDHYTNEFHGWWLTLLRTWHVVVLHKMADEFSSNYFEVLPEVKHIFVNGNYVEIFDFVQFCLRRDDCPYGLVEGVSWALENSRAAYRVVDDDTIMPIASEQEAKAVTKAFADLSSSGLRAAKSHLKVAASELSRGQFASSVRESIHAVESVSRKLAPEANTLAPALAALEKKIQIHPALRSSFNALYGYTSDQKGIRHALIDDISAQVDETDALYMLGACAAFVSYLVGKAKSGNLLSGP